MKTCIFVLLLLIGSYANGQNTTLDVTNFGAVGDAVQFYVNTTSNSAWVTTTNQMPASAIGDALEIMSAGQPTNGVNSLGVTTNGNLDLIATITNIINGTNIYINLLSQSTLTQTFATYGHDNRANFQNCINAAGTNTVIVPPGKYLILSSNGPGLFGCYGILLKNGGLTLNGSGTNTVLLSQFARQLNHTIAGWDIWRGFLFMENPPLANSSLPVVLENMVLDGGVLFGNSNYRSYPPNPVDGLGWDPNHDAFVIWEGQYAPCFDQMTWTNLVFQHWRGEMVKSLDGTTNDNLLVENCVFNDGNATAINIYPSLNITNCVFNNLWQIAEYYQAYSTNTCFFQDNVCSNITGNEFALNGGKGNNPYFIMQSNLFYLSGNGNNGIETTPADNVVISNNIFVCQNHANAIVLGSAGYQGTFDNSNIVVCGNTVINPSGFVEIGGGANASDPKRVENVRISGNTFKNPSSSVTLLLDYGWSTNITLSGNDCSQFNSLASSVTVVPGSGMPYANVSTNNLYYTWVQAASANTNYLSYGSGSRYYTSYSPNGCAYVVVNTDSNQIPAGAQILFANQNPFNVPLYLNSVNGTQLTVTNGTAVTVNWVNGQWVWQASNNSSSAAPWVSAISASVPNMGTNPSVFAVVPGPMQLSASASANAGDAISWQWSERVNGGPQTVYSTGSGPNPSASLTNLSGEGGNTNTWTLQVTDTSNGLTAQSQIKLFVMLPPPQGIQVSPSGPP